MKKGIFTVGLLLGFIGGVLLWQRNMDGDIRRMDSQCKLAMKALMHGDHEEVELALAECENIFCGIEGKWAMVTDEAVLNEMAEHMERAKGLCAIGEYADCYGEVISFKRQLRELARRHRPDMKNIL